MALTLIGSHFSSEKAGRFWKAKTYNNVLADRTTRVSNGSAVTNLTYDDEDRLTTLVGSGVSHSYTYNGFDTRVSKTANGSLTAYHRDGAGVTAPLVADSGATCGRSDFGRFCRIFPGASLRFAPG